MPTPLRREQHRGVGRRAQQRQQLLREHEGGGDVHVHDAHERGHVVLLDGRERAEQRGVVQQAVEPAVTLVDGVGDGFVIRRQRASRDRAARCWLPGAPSFVDLRVHGFELAHGAAQQDDFGAGARERQRHRAADAGAGAGDHDDAAAQFIGLRRVRAADRNRGLRQCRDLVSRCSRRFAGSWLSGSRAARTSCSTGSTEAQRFARDAELGELARLRQHVALHRAHGGVE